MSTEFLRDRFREFDAAEAIVWRQRPYSYRWLLDSMQRWDALLDREQVQEGTVAALLADFSPNSVAGLLALAARRSILVPLTPSVLQQRSRFASTANWEIEIEISPDSDDISIRPASRSDVPCHPFYQRLREQSRPGLVLFSSGSSGVAKAAVHDFSGLLEKFHLKRRPLRTISFLLYDHIGGLNTLLHTLSNGGCLITVPDRSPATVMSAVESQRVELLPTSPTFLNLLLISEAYKHHHIRSLRLITYGTEPMPESTLRRLREALPNVALQQTYGLSELGILRSKSKDSSSLWMKIGGEGFETRVVDGMLQVKARSAMLGYLNAPSPFTADGWFVTGDQVEVDGEYFKILGRKSELINVGGEKVYPAEVEGVIEAIPEVASAMVYGEANAILGMIVCASVELRPGVAITEKELAGVVRRYCRGQLAAYKVPMRVTLCGPPRRSARFKKQRLISESR
jgi:acyl-CoA synthetase (AMP-forming)/AMP-acid ligase II